MDRQTYEQLEAYMLSCMSDSAHDKDHVYRVIYVALDIARFEKAVDYDVLLCSCLLHDIGREEQFRDPSLCHAEVGSEKAYRYLLSNGFSQVFAEKVRDCIRTHRFRTGQRPESIEAKILFDADKADVTGTLGIARTLLYKGQVDEPLYTVGANGKVSDGAEDEAVSFFQEYKYKLEVIDTKFYTDRGRQIARERQASARAFYTSMVREVSAVYETGLPLLEEYIDGQAEREIEFESH